MLSKRIVSGLMLVCLIASVTACANHPPDALQRPQPCEEPVIDPTLQGGLAEALQAYQEALRQCNAVNGVSP